ncbi:MAG: methyltransferase domain-containing protein [Vulcanimicrobiaceae bacterium]
MERPAARGGDFSDVDAHDARALIAYLDIATDLGSQDKRESYRAQGIGPGMAVLDAGCGTGDDVRAIAALVGPSGSVTGIDASAAMIDEACKRGVPANARFLQATCAALAFESDAFDACRAERVFQHLNDPLAAARELLRVTKSGGTVLLVDQDWETLVLAGADRGLTRRIALAYADGLANGAAGSTHRGLLRQAGFSHVTTSAVVAMPTLTTAFSQFISAAVDYALEANTVLPDEAHEWLLSLMRAEADGKFLCAVTVFFTLACR